MLKNIINGKRLIIAIVLLVLLVIVVVSENFISSYITEENVPEFKFQSGVEFEPINYGKNILLSNTEGIIAIDKNGHELWRIVHGSASPAVMVEDEYIMIANMGGRDLGVYRADKLIYEIKTEREILSAKLNKHGYVAVATEELGYKGMITVYDKSGTEMFRWHSGKGYIGSMDISDKNKLAVAQIMTDREKLYTRVLGIDMKKNGEVSDFGEVESLVAEVVFRDNGSVVAVSEEGVYGFKRGGGESFSASFGGRVMKSYNINNSNNMVFMFDNGRNGNLLESYSSDGKLRGSFDAEGEIRNMDVNGESIVFAASERIARITPAGKLRREMEVSRDVKSIKIFGSRDCIVVIGGNSAQIPKI